MRRRFILGILISLILLGLVFRQLDFEQLVISLRSIMLLPLFAAVGALLLTLVIRAWRWGYLLAPVKQASMSNLISATSIGASMDMLLPARAGDLIRSYVISSKERTSNITCLSTIFVEKVFDIFVILGIALSMFVAISFSSNKLTLPASFSTAIFFIAGLILIICFLLWFSVSRSDNLLKFVELRLTFLPVKYTRWLRNAIISFTDGLQSLRQRHRLIPVITLSILLWSVFALSNLLVLQSFNLHLPIYSAFLILVFQILGVTVPSGPGFIGTYHAAVIAGLAVFDVPPEMAINVAVVMHAAFFVPFIFAGLFFIWKENLSFQTIWSLGSRERESSNGAEK